MLVRYEPRPAKTRRFRSGFCARENVSVPSFLASFFGGKVQCFEAAKEEQGSARPLFDIQQRTRTAPSFQITSFVVAKKAGLLWLLLSVFFWPILRRFIVAPRIVAVPNVYLHMCIVEFISFDAHVPAVCEPHCGDLFTPKLNVCCSRCAVCFFHLFRCPTKAVVHIYSDLCLLLHPPCASSALLL